MPSTPNPPLTTILSQAIPGYTLLDSGAGRKLERFGDLILDRPSSLASWKQRQPLNPVWNRAVARYSPPDSWSHKGKAINSFKAQIAGTTIELELMSNGQVGLFPEHALYLPLLASSINDLAKRSPTPKEIRVLNLFAYTGLATAFALKANPLVHVTHVDLAKRAIERAKHNVALNSIDINSRVRWIVDDALTFMAREARKGNSYDLIVIDPPSFSRVSKQNSWTLDEKVAEIISLVMGVLNRIPGAKIFFTNHSSASTSEIARNVALDTFGDLAVDVEIAPLSLAEENSPRRLPAGSLIVLCLS